MTPLVAVLGASGAIGSAISEELAQRRAGRLRLVARRPSRVPAGAEAEVLTADLTRPGNVEAAVSGADAIICLAARTGGEGAWRVSDDDPVGARVNTGIVLDLIETVRRGRTADRPVVVFAGTTSQSGRGERLDGTEPDDPASAYDRQKLMAERALKQATADGLMHGVTIRLPTVYGPDGGIVAAMVRKALAGEPLPLWHDGSVERDLVHVTDAAAAFADAVEHAEKLAGGHWLIGTGSPVSVAGLFTAIADTVAAHTGSPPVPLVSVEPPSYATSSDFQNVRIDSSAFRGITGWSPRMDLRAGIDAAVATLRGQR
ncbi:NAD-dependent epimerase/dehydratase [Actinomadura sp. KC06]|uniref:NAD-dependent epimerase/dehydratase family protein n=1 Tax=Actinomadura sp. KC06 TaxID=2530369 RepID=UPI001A9FD417|nr:NAD-dependent epimerase/dehydratase [Actinomadura sp. KC06]